MKKVEFDFKVLSKENIYYLLIIHIRKQNILKRLNRQVEKIERKSFSMDTMDAVNVLLGTLREKIFLEKISKTCLKVLHFVDKGDIIRVLRKVNGTQPPNDFDGFSQRHYNRRIDEAIKFIGYKFCCFGITNKYIQEKIANSFIPERLYAKNKIKSDLR